MHIRDTKIAIIGNSANSMVNFRGPLIGALAREGARVFAFAPDYDDASRDQVRSHGGNPVDFSLDPAGFGIARSLFDLGSLALKLRKVAPEIVLSYFLKPAVLGTWAARLAGTRERHILIEGLGFLFSDDSQQPRGLARSVAMRAFASALRQAKRVLVLNTDDEKILLEGKFALECQLRVVGGIGVDLSHFTIATPVVGPMSFLLVARLIKEKGIADFVAAARAVKSEHPTSQFTVLGGLDKGPLALPKSQMRAWVDEGAINWQEHVTDVRPHIAAASVFVLPSYYREGVPRSSQEALAMGKPIVTTDSVGCRETVINGINGFLVAAQDPEGLAKALRCFIENPILVETMGAKSRELAETRFDVDDANRRILCAMDLD